MDTIIQKKQLEKRLFSPFYYLLFMGGLFALLPSCTSLDEDARSFVSSEGYYKTVADAKAAVTAVYYGLNYSGSQTPYNILFVTGQEFMADDIKMGPGATNADVKAQSTLDHSPSTLRVKEIWQQHYIAINKANIAIDKIPLIPFTTAAEEALLKQYVLEAKFLRGLYYFNLVRLYGSVPLVLHETTTLDQNTLLVSRTSAEEVYDQVIQDFTDAAAGLPWYFDQNGSDAGRANAAAAEAFLSLAYLTLANVSLDDNQRAYNISVIKNREELLKKAIDHSNNIIKRSDRYYDLFEDYAEVFNKATKNGKEHLFSAQFNSSTLANGNGFGNRTAPLGIKALNGTFADEPTPDLIKHFSDNDKRKAVSLTTSYTIGGVTYTIDPKQNDGNSYASYKYYDSDVPTMLGQSGINVPIIRYAEVLLNNAEANNELYGPNEEAYQNYNLIRKRAGLPEFKIGSLTKDQFRDSIYLDRRLELNFEYHRWFDLIRQINKDGDHIMVKTLNDFGKPSANDKHYLYPIPQVEIDINSKLVQNPGW
ncbi:RagB/SusD family nutrient uptake outer membrane protein [Parabacteroides sp. Marseille-P3160]|uniref:RagB/SusD family nutrient uptake outer membrane protein n=1 Tax=Parabacteroides sp. Marseille-P3160 TaxID=1917887 RepID=UPI0009BBB13C|nr:RagB/SusD family nutrient uptake outer membrane protein [Parabacteroides sp. Marseille-P3160]